MSRSKHTDPRIIRAARRIRAPSESRAAGDGSLRRKLGRIFRELNAGPLKIGDSNAQNLRPRVIVRKARRGFYHPAGKTEVLNFLKLIGSIAIYGLRVVELTRPRAAAGKTSLVFGRYEVPGRILLFEQPDSPWRLPGILKDAEAKRLKRFGAMVNVQPGSLVTLVEWPGESLKGFMLEDVLLHELGHHVLQQHKGKRPVRIARTKDHEASAAQFALKQKSRLRADGTTR